jgi:hypothetical protein
VLLQWCGSNSDGRVACLKTVVPFFVSVKKEGEVDLIMIQLNLSQWFVPLLFLSVYQLAIPCLLTHGTLCLYQDT